MELILKIAEYLIGGPILYSIYYIFFLPFMMIMDGFVYILFIVFKKLKLSSYLNNYIKVHLIRYGLTIITCILINFLYTELGIDLFSLVGKRSNVHSLNEWIYIGLLISLIIVNLYFIFNHKKANKLMCYFKPFSLLLLLVNSTFIAITLYFFNEVAMSV